MHSLASCQPSLENQGPVSHAGSRRKAGTKNESDQLTGANECMIPTVRSHTSSVKHISSRKEHISCRYVSKWMGNHVHT